VQICDLRAFLLFFSPYFHEIESRQVVFSGGFARKLYTWYLLI
jgi:hypothetical protein